MSSWLQRIKQPILFQGVNKQTNYFEGWYFKQVSADLKTVFSVIPGISLNDEDPHAFIQTILYQEGQGLSTGYHRFETSAFQYKESPFALSIGANRFTEKGFTLSLKSELDQALKAPHKTALETSLSFGALKPIQTSWLMPNVMGFFAYLSFMECYHGLVSMRHEVSGTLEVAGQTIDMNGGVGYIEKDWGCSFPKQYIWVQSNHFDVPNLDFMCSVAHIPFLGTAFQGFLCNLYFEGVEYRFATYNGSSLSQFHVSEADFKFILVNNKYRLRIQGQMDAAEVLKSPKNGAMSGQIKEGLSGKLTLELSTLSGETLVSASSQCCGMEVVWESGVLE